MKFDRFPTASPEEVDYLKKLIKKVDKSEVPKTPEVPPIKESTDSPESKHQIGQNRIKKLFEGDIAHVEASRKPLDIDNPVELLLLLNEDITPYKWQFEQLMAVAGYFNGDYKNRQPITKSAPYKSLLSAANGSGKDAIVIAAASLWFALKGIHNRAIITSSSFEQIKYQTEPHIKNLCARANKKFGKLFYSTQFHHIVPELGSEIKLFATDEAEHAEGYHSWPNGEMMVCINEAKSVNEEIFKAISRWTGWTHWLEVSSPGGKRGHMYRSVALANCYPAKVELGKYYFRKVTAYDCPHISRESIEAKIEEWGINSPVIRSSIFAEFSDYDQPVIIPEEVFDRYTTPPPQTGSDIGIGLDMAAGGDEDACFVRKGNKVVHSFFFRQENTELAADIVDKQLSGYKDTDYTFNADNGGLGVGFIDKLVLRGWRINRRNNQSPARTSREYLNLGAEMWFHTKRLFEKNAIIKPNVDKLRTQLVTRRYRGFDTTQGKLALQSKKEARAEGLPSPDRADAFVLCFYSYRPNFHYIEPVKETKNLVTISQLQEILARGPLRAPLLLANGKRFSDITGKY